MNCVDCSAPVERPGATGPAPKRCAECNRLRRNAARRARYTADPAKAIAATREWQRANPERKRETAAAWYAADPLRHNARRRTWALANPGRDIAAHRQRAYGLTQDGYDALLAAQGGTCAVEGCEATTSDQGRPLYVDHDHDCCPGGKSCGACVRGLLCNRHNAGMGLFADDPVMLRAAADYLERASRPRLSVVPTA